jgi:hypothetical protein
MAHPIESAADAAPAAPSQETLAIIQTEIQWRVDGGFDARDVIVNRVAAFISLKEHRSDLGPLISSEVDQRLADHAAREATWKGRTDAEKIDRAFAALETDGILARQNFEDNEDNAEEAIAEEAKQAKAAGRKLRGWVYFTTEGTRQAVLEKKMVVYASAFSQSDGALAAVDSDVLARLQGAGLTADWPYRNAAYAITVSGLDWKKRRAKP